MPEWNLADLYPSPTAPEIARDLEGRRRRGAPHQGGLSRQARRRWPSDGAVLALRHRGVRALRRADGAARLLCRALLRRQPGRSRARQVLWRHLREADRHLHRDHLLRSRAEPDRRSGDGQGAAEPATWRATSRGSTTSARRSPTSSRRRSSGCSTRRARPVGGAFNRLFNETIAALRFPVAGEPEPLALEMTLNLLSNPDEKKRGAAAEALAKVFKDNVRLFTLITNTLAKDKEISDRWRGFKDVADSRHLANQVEAEVVDALVSSVRAAYPRLSHRYYAMKAKWLGKERLSHWDRNAPLPERPERTFAWNDAQRLVLGAYHDFAPEMSAVAERVLRQALDRCAGAPRQGAGRLRRRDGAVGASVRAAELPRQAARRDDARPRARPRRASDAGAAAGRAAGADAADAGRDGLGVRRDAHLQGAAEGDARAEASARRSSPARSRTCSTRWCARSRSTRSSASCTRRAARAS